jgi:hypothetical protein
MSDRYDVIEALMEDPLNLACVLRILRLGGSEGTVGATLVGPSRMFDGILIFPTFLSLVEAQTARDADRVIEIFELGPGWYMNDVEKEEEYGPLESLDAAVKAAEELLLKKGITILSEVPWETP